jgi:F0F1-type ATP synthase membrane subunit b/b'
MDELETIRDQTDSEDARIRKERRALKAYREDVASRITKLEEQSDNCVEDAPDTARERAEEIRESAITTHLDDPDVPDTGFKSASDL